MAVTRINNNQISDASAGNAFVGINAGTKIQPYSITATKIANNLTYGSDLTITGNLTVQGNTTAIDTTFTTIEDPIILLASNQTGAPSVDIGFVGERGTSNNIAFVWDESSSEFVTVFTASGETNTTVSISSYANFHTNDANVGGNIVINGTTSLVGNLTSNVNITGNLAAGNVSTNGLVNAIGNVTGGNLNTGGQVAAIGNVAGGNVNATSNVTGTGAVFSGNVTAQNFIGNISGNIDAGGANTNIQFNDGDILAGSAALTFDKTSNAVVASGNITAGNASIVGTTASTSKTTGALKVAGGVGVAGDIYAGNSVVVDGGTYGNVTTTQFASVFGTGAGPNPYSIMQVRSSDGTSGLGMQAYTGSGTLYGNTAITFALGTIRDKDVPSSLVTKAYIDSTGLNVTGIANISGNITGGNVSAGSGIISTTGNIDGGNINATTVTSTGNVLGGNINTAGQVTATGNITGGNVTTVGITSTGSLTASTTISATGNVSGGNINSNANISATGNVTASYYLGNGSQLTGVVASTSGFPVTAGSSNIAAATNGNIGVSVAATSNVLTIASTGIFTTGLASVTGNVTGGNIITAGLISATGNITSAANVAGANLIATTAVQTPNVVGTTVTVTSTSGLITLAPNSNVSVSSKNINNLAQPVQDNDAASKIYVDNKVTTSISYHEAVIAATNTTLATATGGTIAYVEVNGAGNGIGAKLTTTGSFNLIDTANVQTAGTRILVKNEGNAVFNGIYTWSNATAIVRSTDADIYGPASANALSINDYFFVSSGNVNAGSAWIVDSPDGVITFGTSNIQFAQFSSSQTYSANTQAGISFSGTVISAKVDNDTTAFDVGGNISVKASANLTTPNIGAATGTSLSVTGNLTGAGANVSGNITGGNILTAGIVSAASYSGTTASITGNVTGGNLLTGGVVSATGNITGGNISTSGNITASFYFGNGSQLTGVAANTSGFPVTAGSSNIAAAANGNIGVSVAATSNVLTIASTGIFTTGVSSVTGNITGGNILTAGLISATGNITGGNVDTAGQVAATGNITGGNVNTAGQVAATGNITGGNVATAGQVTATGNVSSGNLNTGGTVNATGNINGAGAVFSGNVTAQNFIGNISGNIDAGGANTNIQFNDGDILAGSSAFTFNKTSNAVVATGNITGSNILTGGQLVSTLAGNSTTGAGQIFLNGASNNRIDWAAVGTGAPALTTRSDGTKVVLYPAISGSTVDYAIGIDSATMWSSIPENNNSFKFKWYGAATEVANLSGTGVFSASGNVTGANILTGGYVTATGNVTGGNLILTTGIIDGPASGRITINGSDIDTDFAVDGDTVANVFYVDAGTGTASFGNSIQTTNAIVAFNATNSIVIPVGNTAQRPATGQVGMLRFNSTNSGVEVYNSSEWIEVGSPTFTLISDQQFNGDGATVAFTLSAASTTNSAIVSINGVVQIPTIAYSVGGVGSTTLTFTEAPQTGDLIDVRVLTTTSQIVSISNSPGTAVVAPDPTLGNVNITGNLVPVANNTQSLGSPTLRWTELYVSGNTITMGNVVMKNVAGGNSIGFFGPDGSTPATIAPTSVDTTTIANGTSNVSVASSGGDVRVNIGGTSNVMVVGSTGANLTGVLTVSGNIVSSGSNGVANIGSATTFFNTVHAKATSAQYADLAENYVADAAYAPGTVLSFGGEHEVTLSTVEFDRRIAGVVSTNPSYIMNSTLEGEFVVTVALTGRVPTFVSGAIAKGDMMVSDGNGRAVACATPVLGTVIGKALENHPGGNGVIEVVVGRL